MDYKKAGVDIEAGYKSVELMKEHVKKTMRPILKKNEIRRTTFPRTQSQAFPGISL